jgi:hypothetical protein
MRLLFEVEKLQVNREVTNTLSRHQYTSRSNPKVVQQVYADNGITNHSVAVGTPESEKEEGPTARKSPSEVGHASTRERSAAQAAQRQ